MHARSEMISGRDQGTDFDRERSNQSGDRIRGTVHSSDHRRRRGSGDDLGTIGTGGSRQLSSVRSGSARPPRDCDSGSTAERMDCMRQLLRIESATAERPDTYRRRISEAKRRDRNQDREDLRSCAGNRDQERRGASFGERVGDQDQRYSAERWRSGAEMISPPGPHRGAEDQDRGGLTLRRCGSGDRREGSNRDLRGADHVSPPRGTESARSDQECRSTAARSRPPSRTIGGDDLGSGAIDLRGTASRRSGSHAQEIAPPARRSPKRRYPRGIRIEIREQGEHGPGSGRRRITLDRRCRARDREGAGAAAGGETLCRILHRVGRTDRLCGAPVLNSAQGKENEQTCKTTLCRIRHKVRPERGDGLEITIGEDQETAGGTTQKTRERRTIRPDDRGELAGDQARRKKPLPQNERRKGRRGFSSPTLPQKAFFRPGNGLFLDTKKEPKSLNFQRFSAQAGNRNRTGDLRTTNALESFFYLFLTCQKCRIFNVFRPCPFPIFFYLWGSFRNFLPQFFPKNI